MENITRKKVESNMFMNWEKLFIFIKVCNMLSPINEFIHFVYKKLKILSAVDLLTLFIRGKIKTLTLY